MTFSLKSPVEPDNKSPIGPANGLSPMADLAGLRMKELLQYVAAFFTARYCSSSQERGGLRGGIIHFKVCFKSVTVY